MPRQPRLDIPGVLQHVIARGIDRGEIFRDDDDRERFVARFDGLLVETGTACLAWALVPNHFHLLLRTTETSLASFMRRLMTGYAVTFNLRHQRSGHVFQNRYKSIVCEEEEYLLALVRYIGLNPLRARLVGTLEELDRYPWSSHAVLMGHRVLEGQGIDEVLARFGNRRKEAVKGYRVFVAAGVPLGRQPELVGGGLRRSLMGQGGAMEGEPVEERQAYDDRVLGSGTFVESLWERGAIEADVHPPLSLEQLTARVAEAFRVDPGELLYRRRLPLLRQARSAICFLAVRCMGYSGIEVGRWLGMRRSAASAAVRRGQAVVQGNARLLRLVETQSELAKRTTSPC